MAEGLWDDMDSHFASRETAQPSLWGTLCPPEGLRKAGLWRLTPACSLIEEDAFLLSKANIPH